MTHVRAWKYPEHGIAALTNPNYCVLRTLVDLTPVRKQITIL
jgi:hypothetical protein